MSNVRISNGSPTLERMEARQSEYPKPSACRNLFGPVNHEELNRDLKKHRQEMEEACQRKWNFDFQNHKPLEGRYEWQAVEKGSSPDFYFRPPRLLKAVCKTSGRQSLDVNGNCQTVVFVGSQGISEDTHCVDQKTDVSENQTDFAEQCTGQRKRPATDGNVPSRKPQRFFLRLPCRCQHRGSRPLRPCHAWPGRGGLCPAGHRLGVFPLLLSPKKNKKKKAQVLLAVPGGGGGVPSLSGSRSMICKEKPVDADHPLCGDPASCPGGRRFVTLRRSQRGTGILAENGKTWISYLENCPSPLPLLAFT